VFSSCPSGVFFFFLPFGPGTEICFASPVPISLFVFCAIRIYFPPQLQTLSGWRTGSFLLVSLEFSIPYLSPCLLFPICWFSLLPRLVVKDCPRFLSVIKSYFPDVTLLLLSPSTTAIHVPLSAFFRRSLAFFSTDPQFCCFIFSPYISVLKKNTPLAT